VFSYHTTGIISLHNGNIFLGVNISKGGRADVWVRNPRGRGLLQDPEFDDQNIMRVSQIINIFLI